jgi:hypothetical protein
MSRSLSWFDSDLLRALLSGSGVALSSRHGPFSAFSDHPKAATLVGQFGHTSRFALNVSVSEGRFGQAVTRPEPDPLPFSSTPELDQKATRLASGAVRPSTPHPPSTSPSSAPPAAYPLPTEYVPIDGASIERQLESFMHWALAATQQERVFMADRDGLLLAHTGFAMSGTARSGAERLAGAVCPAFELTLATMEGAEQALAQGHLVLERADGPLAVVWASAPHGRLFVGLSGAAPPSVAALTGVAQALRTLVVALVAS